MIRAQQIVDRLTADAGASALLKFIGLGADMPSAIDQLQASPSAFVGEGFGERAEPNAAATMVTRQGATAFFAILLVFNGIGPTGTAQDSAVIDAREALKDALIGWTPNSSTDNPINYAGAKTLAIDTDTQVLVYQCNFSSSYTIRKVNDET